MKNCLFHAQPPSPFPLPYLDAVQTFADPILLAIGPMLPVGGWADKMQLLTGELARWTCGTCGAKEHCEHWAERTIRPHLNIVCAPMGAMLGTVKSVADFAPDGAELNPDLATQNPDVAAAGEEARRQKHRAAYSPQTAFQGRYIPDQTNIAILQPIRAKRAQLEVDLEILEKYALVIAPAEHAHLFRDLGAQAIGCDPSSFAVTIEPFLE